MMDSNDAVWCHDLPFAEKKFQSTDVIILMKIMNEMIIMLLASEV
jgi:hypothetical protein